MIFRCDDYSVTPVSVYSAHHNASVIAPEVVCRYNGAVVWRGVSWAVAHHLNQWKSNTGKPPWREYLTMELRLVAVDGKYHKYAIL